MFISPNAIAVSVLIKRHKVLKKILTYQAVKRLTRFFFFLARVLMKISHSAGTLDVSTTSSTKPLLKGGSVFSLSDKDDSLKGGQGKR